ncbi:MAG: hypothetical protein LBC85_06935, partial [Fibromonadaceae bacterium]|jgi:antitoxin component of RelBE/YafQ-DinJ toxin-antitoxin module|nr:hypothetical protein [Fibromonadaceae bacterium]
LTTAIRLYLTQLVFHRGIPFPIVLEKQESIPNDETIEAFKWTENYIKSGKKNGFKTTKELYRSPTQPFGQPSLEGNFPKNGF